MREPFVEKDELRRVEKVAVLDFGSLLNPLVLLESLLVFPPLDRKLVVGAHSVSPVAISILGKTAEYDLADPAALPYIDDFFTATPVHRLRTSNAGLGIRIFQFALAEGLIDIVPAPVDVETFVGLPQVKLPSWNHRQPPELALDFGSFAFAKDMALARSLEGPLISDPAFGIPVVDSLHHQNLLESIESESVVASLRLWEPSSLREVFGIINAGRLMLELVAAVRAAVEREIYEKDLRLFLPRWGLDLATGGLSSLVEMLIMVGRRSGRR